MVPVPIKYSTYVVTDDNAIFIYNSNFVSTRTKYTINEAITA